MCKLFGVTKQAYFKDVEHGKVLKLSQEAFALDFIKRIRAKDSGIGGRKLWYMYIWEFQGNTPLGRDRFEALIDKYGLKVRTKMRVPRTTDSHHGLPLYPNLIKTFIPTGAYQLWVSDITYIPIWITDEEYRFCYLSLIMDGYTREIMGYQVGATLETYYCMLALQKALEKSDSRNADLSHLIHHSDRGIQYASAQYVSILSKRGITLSMTEDGNPKDNPQAERINSTIKNELFKGKQFHSILEVRLETDKAVEFYNTQRPHMSIDLMAPMQVLERTGEIKKKWKSYRDRAIKNLAPE